MMKSSLKIVLILGLLVSPILIIAAPGVTTSPTAVSYHPETNMQQSEPIIVKLSSPTLMTPKPKSMRVTLYPGSLRTNIERIAKLNGWTQLEWLIPTDYEWVGQTEVRGTGFQDILNQIIKDYPMQAIFYMGNHVLVIQPRTLK